MAPCPLCTRKPVVKRWIVIVSLGEAAGFAVATTVALLVILTGVPAGPAFAAIVGGGAIEGTLLGTAQWLAMPGTRPPALRWIPATAAGAAIAWSLGMLPSTLGLVPSTPETYLAFAAGALALLASIPVLQWAAIARTGTGRWIPVNMGAWAVAVLWTAAPSPIIDETSPTALIAALYVLAGLLMAVTIAALTAKTATRLFPPD